MTTDSHTNAFADLERELAVLDFEIALANARLLEADGLIRLGDVVLDVLRHAEDRRIREQAARTEI